MFQNRLTDNVVVCDHVIDGTYQAHTFATTISGEGLNSVNAVIKDSTVDGACFDFLLDTELPIGTLIAVTYDLVLEVRGEYIPLTAACRTYSSSSYSNSVSLANSSAALSYDLVGVASDRFIYRMSGSFLVPVIETTTSPGTAMQQRVAVGFFKPSGGSYQFSLSGQVRAYVSEELFFQPTK